MQEYKTTIIQHSKTTIISDKGKQHVVVIGGGMSAERKISLISSIAVNKALEEAGYKVTFIDMGMDIATAVTKANPDIVYNCLHGTYGEDGCLPGLLNILQIPYTHSGIFSSSLAFNKTYAKSWFDINNIKTAKSIIVHKLDNVYTDPMKRPYVIKPLAQGSSIGIEVIFPEDHHFNFADYNFPYGDQVIVEQYIKGREIQVAVLNGKALGALEIKPLKRRFYDYDTKYKEGFAKHLCPAPLPPNMYDRLLKKSEKIHTTMNCKGVTRVEFIYNEELEEFFALEINTHPGMTPLSIVPEIANLQGINFTSLIEEILKTASFEI